AARAKVVERGDELVGGRVVEAARHVYVADAGLYEVCVGHGRLRHRVAGYLDRLLRAVRRALDRYLDGRAARAAQAVAHFARRLARDGLAVNLRDAVAEAEARSEGGRALEGREDVCVGALPELAVADGRPDAVVLGAPVGALLLELFRVVVVRVRVERPQHAYDRGLEHVVVDELVAVNVVVLYDRERLGHVGLDAFGGVRARRGPTRASAGRGGRDRAAFGAARARSHRGRLRAALAWRAGLLCDYE